MKTFLGHPAHRLGHIQKHVLLVLANRGPSARSDWTAWYPLRSEQVYGAMDGLYRRGLVDVAGFEDNSRTFAITKAGLEAIDGEELED